MARTPVSIALTAEGVEGVRASIRSVSQAYQAAHQQMAAQAGAGVKLSKAEQAEQKAKLAGYQSELKVLRELASARGATERAAKAEHSFQRAIGTDRSISGAFMQGEGMGGMLKAAGVAGIAIGGMMSAINLATAGLRQFAGFLISDVIKPQMALQTRSVQVANNSGGKLTAAEVESKSKAIGIKTNTSPMDIIEGAGIFQNKTGEPTMGFEIMETISKIAKGRGMDTKSLTGLAASVYTPGMKTAELEKTMLALTGQGEAGTVTIDELARQGGKLHASAGKLGGGAFANHALANSMIQMVRPGFGTADEAMTGVESTLQQILTHGETTIGHGTIGKFNGVQAIADLPKTIGKILQKTGGDSGKLKAMGFEETGIRTIQGFKSTYSTGYSEAKDHGKSELEARKAGGEAVTSAMLEMASKTETANGAVDKLAAVMATDGERMEAAMERIRAGILKGMPAIEGLVSSFAENAPAIGEAGATLATGLIDLAEVVKDVASGMATAKDWFDRQTGSKTDAGTVKSWAWDEGGKNTRLPDDITTKGHWERAAAPTWGAGGKTQLQYIEDREGQDPTRGRAGHYETRDHQPVFIPDVDKDGKFKLRPAGERAPKGGPLDFGLNRKPGDVEPPKNSALDPFGGLTDPGVYRPGKGPLMPGAPGTGPQEPTGAAPSPKGHQEAATHLSGASEHLTGSADKLSRAAEKLSRAADDVARNHPFTGGK